MGSEAPLRRHPCDPSARRRPKTGTTYSRTPCGTTATRSPRGVLYPLERPDEHFAMTMDLRRIPGRTVSTRLGRPWEHVVARIADSPAPRAVLSDELLGGASPEQIRRAVDLVRRQPRCTSCSPPVISPGRCPRTGRSRCVTVTRCDYERFVDDLSTLGREAPAPFGEMFWELHDPMTVLPKWAEVVGNDRVHVVTVPPPGASTGSAARSGSRKCWTSRPASCSSTRTRAPRTPPSAPPRRS